MVSQCLQTKIWKARSTGYKGQKLVKSILRNSVRKPSTLFSSLSIEMWNLRRLTTFENKQFFKDGHRTFMLMLKWAISGLGFWELNCKSSDRSEWHHKESHRPLPEDPSAVWACQGYHLHHNSHDSTSDTSCLAGVKKEARLLRLRITLAAVL